MQKFHYFCSMNSLKTHTQRCLIILVMFVAQLSVAFAQAPFSVGLRAGINSSNITENRIYSGALGVHNTTWKPGFMIGAVVDIPISGKFALSPGFFYDRRNSDYASSYIHNEMTEDGVISLPVYAEGSTSTNWFHIPMLVSFKFFPVRAFGINLDFGPYISFGLSGSSKIKCVIYQDNETNIEIPHTKHSCFKGDDSLYFNTDWGFKAGGGLVLFRHIYIGAHYMFGLRNLAKNKAFVSKSHTREWQFTVGYNF